MSGRVYAGVKASPKSSFTPVRTGLLTGSCGKPLVSQPPLVQAKLTINQPNDQYEREADRVADAVIRMPEPGVQWQVEPEEEEEMLQSKPLANQITPLVQVQRQEEPGGEEEMLQAKSREDATSEVTNDLESHINAIRGGGRHLAESERAYFEPRFGYDFGQVRVHIDTLAAESAQAVNARAFTTRQDVVFGAGQYAPGTSEGKRLLAHELTHVVQQSDGRVSSQLIQRNPTPVLLTHTVPLVTQQSSNTCWAASVAMLASYFTSTNVRPIDVALRGDQVITITSTYYSDLYALNSGLPVSYINYRDLVAPWGLVVLGSVGLGTVAEWFDILYYYGPVVLDRYTLQPRHAVVVTGIEGDGTPQGTFLYINDPSGRQTTLPVQSISAQLMHIIQRAQRL